MKSNPKKVKAALTGRFYIEYDSIYQANNDKRYLVSEIKRCGGKKKDMELKVLRK